MRLRQLLKNLTDYDLEGDSEIEIKGLAYDSRQVKPGYLFVALKGHRKNGHDFLRDAVHHGAVAFVAENFEGLQELTPRIQVPDPREALSKMAIQFYHHPYKKLNLIGITGTNGKTTTSYLLESILAVAGRCPGIIGTINYHFPGRTLPAPVTTPESLDLMRILREMADASVTDVVMEVSSHALDQQRVRGCPFGTAIFTNLSRDHLDYHLTMEKYFEAKSLLFRRLPKNTRGKKSCAVINMDDPKGKELAALTSTDVVTYGLGRQCQVRASNLTANKHGLQARLITPKGELQIESSLLGEMNIYNILAAAAAALSLNLDLSRIGDGIKRMTGVPGRMELVSNRAGLSIVVDYSHTPDALLKALTALRPLTEERLITVFGCGGDRDQGKRPEMGSVAAEKSDMIIITSDNPRSEDPETIIAQIEKGAQAAGLIRVKAPAFKTSAGGGYLIEVDRREAIRKAVKAAGKNDLILIAGKGHENYQIMGAETRHFDDREEAARAASEMSS